MKKFKNKNGFIPIGSKVYFRVENQDRWCGDIVGTLQYDLAKKEFYIQTEHSGKITIDKGYDAYWNTIEKAGEGK